MLGYEFAKICKNRFFLVSMVVLLCCHALLLFGTSYNDVVVSVESMDALFTAYREDPVKVETYYQELQAFYQEQNEIAAEHVLHGESYTWSEPAHRYSDREDVSDRILLTELFAKMDYIQSYHGKLETVIRAAERNIASYERTGISPKSYIYQYQYRIIDTYTHLANEVTLALEYTHGWEELFTWQSVDIFIAAAILLLAATIFPFEQRTGILPIMKCTRYGRTKTYFCKCTVFVVGTIGIVFAFMLTTGCFIGVRYGYSSPYTAVQIMETFQYCPYRINILTYLHLYIGGKTLSFLCFGTMVLCISVLTYHMFLTCMAGIGLFALQYVLNVFRYINAYSILKYGNVWSTAAVYPLFRRYLNVNVFGYAVDMSLFLLVCQVILTLCVFVGVYVVYVHKHTIPSFRLPAIQRILSPKQRKQRWRRYATSLWQYEWYKVLISSRFVWLILLLYLVKCLSLAHAYDASTTIGDRVYHEYMTIVAGEKTVEKERYLEEEHESIQQTLLAYDTIQSQYVAGEISFETYSAYLQRHNYAVGHETVLHTIQNHGEYIDWQNEQGYDAWFVYATGWNHLFYNSFDWTLYALALMLFSGIFGMEYDSTSSANDFAMLLRTTQKGRQHTYQMKLLSALSMTFLLSVMWIATDLVYHFTTYDMPMPNAPLHSLQSMSAFPGHITIGQYLLLYVIVRIVAMLFFTLGIVCLSAILHRAVVVLGTVAMVTFVPFAAQKFDVSLLSGIDYVAYMRATPVLIRGSGCIVYTLVVAILCGMLVKCSQKRFY